MSRYIAYALASVATFASSAAIAAPVFDAIFSDGAVIQRDKPIVVSGFADAGEAITISLGSDTATTQADAKGRWQATLPARSASKDPAVLVAIGSNGSKAQASDILVGDVWYCSGQSNMELQVSRSTDSFNQLGRANDPHFRIVTIPQVTSFTPRDRFDRPISWKAATRESVSDFSAACYFMVKNLKAQENVPMGAINASWGGTQIKAWLDPVGTESVYGKAEAEKLKLFARDPLAAVTAEAPVWETWWRNLSGDQPGKEPWKAPDSLTWQPMPQVSAWDFWPGASMENYRGLVWLRKTITLTKAQAAKGVTVNLGVIDDQDHTWINGRAIGNSYGWGYDRSYKVPGTYLKAGANELVVAVINGWGSGGPIGPSEKMTLVHGDGTTTSLAEGWRYAKGRQGASAPRTAWDTIAGLGVIQNAMVAPLGSIAVRGAAWYQGESDVGMPGYDKRLAALFDGWRRQFRNATMPVVVVSLANFETPARTPQDSGWAKLREEQRQAVLKDRYAALANAIDLGDRLDIHPTNKVELGRRMARAMRNLSYDPTLSASGPVFGGVRRDGADILVSIGGAKAPMSAWSSATAIGFELCGSTQTSCRFASAVVDGPASIRIKGDGLPVSEVRYAWADNPVVNLYDADGMPLEPFKATLP